MAERRGLWNISRRELIASALLMAACQNKQAENPPFPNPEAKQEFQIGCGKTVETPPLTIVNNTSSIVTFRPSNFAFTVGECLINQPQLLEGIKPHEMIFTLDPNEKFPKPELSFDQVKTIGDKDIHLAVGHCLADIRSHPSSDPYETKASAMLSYLFLEGIFCWAEKRQICPAEAWKEISINYFRIPNFMRRVTNFAGFNRLPDELLA